METTELMREKFEIWAAELGHSLTRHPNNEEFYYKQDVSALWVCFSTAYKLGNDNAEVNLAKFLFDDED